MRFFFFISLFLASTLLAASKDVDVETLLSPEKLAAYSAPGESSRYTALEAHYAKKIEELGPPARNIKLPVRNFPDGRAQTIVRANYAWIDLDMTVLRGRDVTVENYLADGTIDSSLHVEEIVVDRNTRLGVARGAIHGTYGKDIITGRDARCDLNAEYVIILKDAKIVTPRTAGADLTRRGMF